MNFTEIVARICEEMGLGKEVPSFDRGNGNESAKYLLLLEAPGPKAVESGQISFENPAPTARNLRKQLEEAEIGREDIAIWNVVPWYIGNKNGTVIRSANGSDVQTGMQYLNLVLEAMPNLRCILNRPGKLGGSLV